MYIVFKTRHIKEEEILIFLLYFVTVKKCSKKGYDTKI